MGSEYNYLYSQAWAGVELCDGALEEMAIEAVERRFHEMLLMLANHFVQDRLRSNGLMTNRRQSAMAWTPLPLAPEGGF
jgi:hypothetical protein